MRRGAKLGGPPRLPLQVVAIRPNLILPQPPGKRAAREIGVSEAGAHRAQKIAAPDATPSILRHSLEMPRFFFHLRGPDGLSEDPDGIVLPDLSAARAEAELTVRDVLADQLKTGQRLDHQQFEICDRSGRILAVMPFLVAIGSK